MLVNDLNTKNRSMDSSTDMCSGYRAMSNFNKYIFNQKEMGYSSYSIVQSMETFIEAVREMEETILIPTMLLDLKVDSKTDCKSIEGFNTVPDLYSLYTTIQNLKNQLRWGGVDSMLPSTDMTISHTGTVVVAPSLTSNNNNNNNTSKGHNRRPSNGSMSSAASVISEVESDTSTENDSGVDGEGDNGTTSCLELLEQNFYRHIHGLRNSLKQLTDAAQYLTKRYQTDVLRM